MNNDVVIIQLDRPRRLKFCHTSLKTLSELTGKTLKEIDEGFDLLDFQMVEQAVYCGLLYESEKKGEQLEFEKIPKMLDEAPSQAHIWEKLLAAWAATHGAPATLTEGNQSPAEQPAKENANTTGKKASA